MKKLFTLIFLSNLLLSYGQCRTELASLYLKDSDSIIKGQYLIYDDFRAYSKIVIDGKRYSIQSIDSLITSTKKLIAFSSDSNQEPILLEYLLISEKSLLRHKKKYFISLDSSIVEVGTSQATDRPTETDKSTLILAMLKAHFRDCPTLFGPSEKLAISQKNLSRKFKEYYACKDKNYRDYTVSAVRSSYFNAYVGASYFDLSFTPYENELKYFTDANWNSPSSFSFGFGYQLFFNSNRNVMFNIDLLWNSREYKSTMDSPYGKYSHFNNTISLQTLELPFSLGYMFLRCKSSPYVKVGSGYGLAIKQDASRYGYVASEDRYEYYDALADLDRQNLMYSLSIGYLFRSLSYKPFIELRYQNNGHIERSSFYDEFVSSKEYFISFYIGINI